MEANQKLSATFILLTRSCQALINNAMEINVDRLSEGLRKRVMQVTSVDPAGQRESTDRDSIFETFVSQITRYSNSTSAGVNKRWLSISAAARSLTLQGQFLVLTSLSDHEDLAVCTAYSVGYIFSNPDISDADLDKLSDADYSIIAESALRAGRASGHLDAAEKAIREFLKSLPHARPNLRLGPAESVVSRFAPFWEPWPVDKLSSLRSYLSEVKSRIIHITGPDVFTSLQALTDPVVKMSKEQAVCAVRLLADWGLRTTALTLLFARATGPYPGEQEALRELWDETGHGLPRPLRAIAWNLTNRSIVDQVSGSPSQFFIGKLLHYLNNLGFALQNASAYDVYDAILHLYELDPLLVEFLPWDEILAIVDLSNIVSAKSVFTTMLMGTREIRRSSEAVAIQVGRGALIGDLKRLIQADRTIDVVTVASAFRSLPTRAAMDLTHATLHPPIFDRLSGASPPQSDIAGGLSTQTLARTLLRIEAVRHAAKLGLMAEDFAEREIEREKDLAKLEYFQHKMLSGRVRIPWEAIEKSTKALTERLPLEFLHQRLTGSEQRDVAERAAEFFADNVAQYILLEANVSIDQVLSNNLRHGIVVPRFLRSFDDALQVISPTRRHLPAWEIDALEPHFEDDTVLIIGFREYVNTILSAFLQQELTVTPHGELDCELRAELTNVIRDYLLGPLGADTVLEVDISKATERVLRKGLVEAADNLLKTTKPAIFEELMSLRGRAGHSSSLTNGYLDVLDTNLHAAFEEVSQWIGVAERSDVYEPFKLGDLIKLELLSTHLANWRKFRVTSICYDEITGEAKKLVKGEYFDLLFESVHNLISNSLKYSGLASKTEIRFELVKSLRGLEVVCFNSVAPEKMDDLTRRRPRIQAQAMRAISSEARDDRLSGFFKIRRIFLRYFGNDPDISIEVSSPRRRSFTVKIRVVDPPDIWAADETSSSR